MLDAFHGALTGLRDLPAVSVAVVDGHCLGGGMELAAACDMVVASDRSRFGQPEIKLGCYPPLAAALYPHLLGPARTFDLLLTGRTLDCEEAEQIGFVSRRFAAADFEAGVTELVDQITSHSRAATLILKQAIRAGREQPLESALAECERLYLEDLLRTEDMHEGLAALLERRPPRWSHR